MYFSNKIEKHYLFYPYFSLQSFIFQFNPLLKNTLNWMLIWVNKDAIMQIYIYIYKMRIKLNILKKSLIHNNIWDGKQWF